MESWTINKVIWNSAFEPFLSPYIMSESIHIGMEFGGGFKVS